MIFLTLALARPQWGKHEETVKITGLDLFIALDLSNSMMVEDVIPSRLQKAKHWARSFLSRLNGDRVGIVAFAGSSFVASPLTTDLGYVEEIIDGLSPKSISNQGTDLGIAIKTVIEALDRGAEDLSAQSGNNLVSRGIVLISDGEDHEDKISEATALIKKSETPLFILGVGTEKGGPIPVRDEAGQLHGFKKDGSGQAVVSRLEEASLKKLAEETGGKYWRISDPEDEIDELLHSIGELNRKDFEERRIVRLEERFQWPLLMAIFFFSLELLTPLRKKLNSSKLRVGIAGALIILINVPASRADPLRAYVENERGIQELSKAEKPEEAPLAQEHFEKAKKQAPGASEIEFNQGLGMLKAGDPQAARQFFDESAKKSAARGEWGKSARALFNRAIAESQGKQSDQAVDTYLRALDTAAQAHDAELEEKIRKNLELLAAEPPEKQESKKESKDDKKDGKDDKKEEKKPDPNESNQDDSSKKQQSKKLSQQKFKSDKLTKEDAEKVMAELSNREKDLQSKVKRQKGNDQHLEKDW